MRELKKKMNGCDEDVSKMRREWEEKEKEWKKREKE